MERIGDEVQGQLARFEGAGAMPRLVSAWPELVGEEVARNAWPARVARDGTLLVNTSSSVWAFELGQLAPRILERFRGELGEGAPTGLRFVQGPLPEPVREKPQERVPEARDPSPDAIRRASELAAGIEAEELRKIVERAVSVGLSPRGDGR
jgi:hypothetical protein